MAFHGRLSGVPTSTDKSSPSPITLPPPLANTAVYTTVTDAVLDKAHQPLVIVPSTPLPTCLSQESPPNIFWDPSGRQ